MAKQTDSLDVDSTAPLSEVTAHTPSAKDQNKDTGVAQAPSMAFVVHSVACIVPKTYKIWEVEGAFVEKGVGVIGCDGSCVTIGGEGKQPVQWLYSKRGQCQLRCRRLL